MPIHSSLEILLSSCQRKQPQETRNQWDNKDSSHQSQEVVSVETEEEAASEVEAVEEIAVEASEAEIEVEDSVVEIEAEAEASVASEEEEADDH